MTKNNEIDIQERADSFDEIVFVGRNREYGAYYLRKKYNKYILIAFLFGFSIVSTAVVTPLVYSYYNRDKLKRALENIVTAELENIKNEEPPPPPPPPPPPAEIVQQIKFVAPEVVDTVKDEVEIATADDLVSVINEPPPTEIVVEEKKDEVIVEEKIFFAVEESATFMGGDIESFRGWIQEHMKFPESAIEMGIEGKVILSFVINSRGAVENAKILRGVDPALDQEVIRVIQSSPKWIPGKQGGKAVKQQFTIPIAFKLQK